MKQKVKAILISGTGRSGTNITKKIMTQHSNVVSLPFEHRFVIDPGGIVDFYNSYSTTWSPYMADIKIKNLERFLLSLSKKKIVEHFFGSVVKTFNKNGKKISPNRYHGWELNKWFPNYEKHVKNMILELKTFEYNGCWPGTKSYSIKNKIYFSEYKDKKQLADILGSFVRNCIIDLLRKNGKEYFIEDNTWNILFARELFEILPETKLIHVYRDPRDVIASLKNQRWSPNRLNQTVSWYKEIIQRWFSIRQELPSNSYLEIRLEDLVKNTKNVLIKICKFSELPFEDNMLKVNLNKSHSGRWNTDFTEQEKQVLNDNLSDILYKLNY